MKLNKEFQPLDEIFVWHKAAITNRYSVGDSGFSHMYLADDMSEAVITDNRQHLLYMKPLRGLHTSRCGMLFGIPLLVCIRILIGIWRFLGGMGL